MESLHPRQVSGPDNTASDPRPLGQRPNATIELDDLTRSTSSVTTDDHEEHLHAIWTATSDVQHGKQGDGGDPSAAASRCSATRTSTNSHCERGPGRRSQPSEDSTAIDGEEKSKEVISSSAPLSLDSNTGETAADEGQPLASTVSPSTDVANPVCNIMLLLTSGARHGYRVDERYLLKRQMTIPGVTETGKKDPYSISVIMLKELILKEWREEWDAKPTSPSSIRLIYFGRLLNDNVALKECRFNETATNVVHMTVRPQDIVDEEETERKRAEARQHERPEQRLDVDAVSFYETLRRTRNLIRHASI
ncbi:hypothetical protein VE04_01824 [Pseudogymnoascus sp. 24MN13]|nr:hypothetical protein VE04_01824 [Pseudogymnoascus sp. 24MN13]